MTQAVILAGGKGTRLAARLQGLPKCLVDIDGVPLLRRQIQQLKSNGIDEVVLLANSGAEQVTRFLDDNADFGSRVAILNDGEPRGTAGAVLAALDQLGPRFVVIYGDTLFDIDLVRLTAAHASAGADVTLFLHPNDHPFDSDLVEVDDAQWVRAFHPHPRPTSSYYANLVNAALYVVEKRALEPWLEFKTPSDFGKDLFPAMLAGGARLKGYVSFEYIKDIGTLTRLAKAVDDLRRGVVGRANLKQKQKAVFLDRDGVLNVHRGFLRRVDEFELLPGAADAVRTLNELEYRVVVLTNQPVIARGESTFEELRTIHAKLESELGAVGAFLDALYICPHHPDSGFPGEIADLKIHCDCRKPKTGMIDRAVADLNIDLSRSWLIGDTTGDMETARRAGIRSILVRSGEAGADEKYLASANIVANDLSEAVSVIALRHEGAR